MPPASPSAPGFRAPHPLAARLIAAAGPQTHVIEIGTGSGRNAAALAAAGLPYVSIGQSAPIAPLVVAQRFNAALSTHALLHGTPHSIANRLAEIARALEAGSPLYATFGSTADARYGSGDRIDDATFAPVDGDERGVAHAYFDESHLRALLSPHFEPVHIEAVAVDSIAGAWAHLTAPLHGAVHWFVEARRC